MTNTPQDPEFLEPNDEWMRTGNYDNLYPEVNKGSCVEFMKMTVKEHQEEMQKLQEEEDAASEHRLALAKQELVDGSFKQEVVSAWDTFKEQNKERQNRALSASEVCTLQEQNEIMEEALWKIAAIKKVESPHAEAFFFMAASLRKIAINALQKMGKI